MVFHCRCFSFLLITLIEPDQTGAYMQSDTTYYTAASDFNAGTNSSMVQKPTKLRAFTYAELEAATDNFSPGSKIAGCTVYKGVVKSLEHPFYEIHVAVKRFEGRMAQEEWETEIAVLRVAKHPNLVKLIGYCTEYFALSGVVWLLVYEYMVNRSVKDHLHAKSETPLSWTIRMKVAQDAAAGLSYLHDGMDLPVILRDFKPSNILLDDQWNVKLTGFGSAMTRLREHRTYAYSVGTKEYAAPEHISEGRICCCTPRSDVWSYGVFLYELITGRCPSDTNKPQNEQNLLEWIKPYIGGSKRFERIVDPRLEGNYPLKSAKKLSVIANKCLSENPNSRPKMSEVLEMVNQLIGIPSQAADSDEKTSNENKKDSMCIGIQKTLCSCLSCFKKD